MTNQDSYSLLAPPIQRALWDMGWEALRPIQVDAIREVLERETDIIIAARTASGKTEAAFLPILSRMFVHPESSIQAIYVGPLKALINDQFRRLEELCRRASINVHRWHGDVDVSKKRRFLNNPTGVLLITPESIESLFINHSTAISRLFRHISFVVIDEIHSLIGQERGTHLRSLLYRLQQRTERQFRVVGLSATLGNAFPMYATWLRPNETTRVRLITDEGEKKRVLYRVQAYVAPEGTEESDENEEHEDNEIQPPGIIEDMYDAMVGRRNLIFANRKTDVEWFADSLNKRCHEQGRPDEFLVHHGSLSKEVREFTEQEMQSNRPQTTVCSSTLELGINIGNVSSVGQVDPPWSVNSLVQRLGRSGREENQPQCMRVFVRESQATGKSPLEKRLYPKLLQTIAVTELMLETPTWVEAPSVDECDLSTLTQQMLSVLAECGGIHAAELYRRLIEQGAFRGIDQRVFIALLRHLGGEDVIEQMASDELILAPKGERIVDHYSFYSAFATPVEYNVRYENRLLGSLPSLYVPQPGDHFILAGRRWQVIDLNDEKREVLVAPARGRKPPKFTGGAGEIHPRVREVMKRVLLSKNEYSYLNRTALQLLTEARDIVARAHLDREQLINLGERSCMWFTWTGTKIQRTLCLLMDTVGVTAHDLGIAMQFDLGVADCRARLADVSRQNISPEALAKRIPAKQARKFDQYISDELLTEALARDAIDIPAAKEVISRLL